MSKTHVIQVSLIILCLILVACASENDVPTKIPTTTPSPSNTPKPTHTLRPTNTPTPTPEPVIVTFNYRDSDIIRSTPDLDRSGVAVIEPGDTLFVLGYMQSDRYKIYLVRTVDGVEGWLFWKIGMFDPLDNGEVPDVSYRPIPTMTRPSSTSGAGASSACSCSSDSKNCSDFSNESAAQACLDACSTDVHNLDSDNDGIACED